MFVYVNLLNNWTELSDYDLIDKQDVGVFINNFKNTLTFEKEVYEIIIKDSKDNQLFDNHYFVHKSCIQLVYVEKS